MVRLRISQRGYTWLPHQLLLFIPVLRAYCSGNLPASPGLNPYYRSSASRATATTCIADPVSLFGPAQRPRRSPRPKTASEVAPGRQELPLSMRLSLWSGWVGEQLICPKSLGWRAKMGDVASYLCPRSHVPWASVMRDFPAGGWPVGWPDVGFWPGR